MSGPQHEVIRWHPHRRKRKNKSKREKHQRLIKGEEKIPAEYSLIQGQNTGLPKKTEGRGIGKKGPYDD